MAPFRKKTHPSSVIIKNRMMELFETTDEWIENLSSEDLTALIGYLDEHIGFDENNPSQILWSYNEWRTQTWNHWETMNNLYMNLEAI